jgi:hypothetical protein
VFEVPRSALLLTGTVRALLPLPAGFHQRKDSSAAALGAADTLMSPVKPASNGSAAGMVGINSSSRSSSGEIGQLDQKQQQQQQSATGSGDSGSSSVKGDSPRGGSPGASSVNLASILEHPAHDQHDAAAAHGVSKEPQQMQQTQQQDEANARVLDSPAELPPGDFSCLTEAMLLQVPRGFELPTDLETTTYQAQVLNKGSISLAKRSTSAANSGAAAAAAGLAAADTAELGRHSSKLVSPLKSMSGMLARVSRLAGISRTASDSVPNMPFLQTALASMREQQQERARQDGVRLGSGGSAAAATAAAAVRGYPLRTVAEREGGVRSSMEGLGGAAAAGAGDIEMGFAESALGAGNSRDAAAGDAADAGQQQQGGVGMPRATDVLRGWMEGRSTGGGSASASRLSSNSLTRRSHNSLT